MLWGHHLKDYQEMFDLSKDELSKAIVEYGAGPTSFNVEMKRQSKVVRSCDPLFSLTKEALLDYVNDVFQSTVEEMKATEKNYHWKNDKELNQLLLARQAGIDAFFLDYDTGLKEKRYIPVEKDLSLPFQDFQFSLALITHHLFVNYGDQGLDEHVTLIKELLRVAGEVRIFPLLDKKGSISPLLGPVMLALQQLNFGVEVRQVSSQVQKSGNAMLRVWALKCDVT